METPKDIKPIERAKKEWEEMEQEIETKAHELVANTPSRADDDEDTKK